MFSDQSFSAFALTITRSDKHVSIKWYYLLTKNAPLNPFFIDRTDKSRCEMLGWVRCYAQLARIVSG